MIARVQIRLPSDLAIATEFLLAELAAARLNAAATVAVVNSEIALDARSSTTCQVTVHAIAPRDDPDRSLIPLRWIATTQNSDQAIILDANLDLHRDGPHTILTLTGSWHRTPWQQTPLSDPDPTTPERVLRDFLTAATTPLHRHGQSP